MAEVEVILDVCTAEGKTWLARIVGLGGHWGVERAFINAVSSNLSRSGMTGSKTYVVEEGAFEAFEGRRRLGRSFFVIFADGTRVDYQSAKDAYKAYADSYKA